MGGTKGSGGTPQQQQMMGAAAGQGAKGSGGMPMGQGKGYGGMPMQQPSQMPPQTYGQQPRPYQPQQPTTPTQPGPTSMDDRMAPVSYRTPPPAQPGYPPSMDDRMAYRPQHQEQMAGRQNMIQQRHDQMRGGINSLGNVNRADFMPGGALAAPLEIAPTDPYQAEAAPPTATPPAAPAAPLPPQMSDEARGRLQSQMGQGSLQSRMGGIAGMGKGSGGRGWGRGGASYAPAGRPAMNPRGQYANGGIVTLAGGGLADPRSRGGVSYAPTTPNLPRPAAAAPITAAAPVSWRPQAAAAPVAGGMFPGINPGAITAPAKFSGPTTPQAIWQPPAEPAEAAKGAGMEADAFRRLQMARMLGIPIKGQADLFDQMSDRQYIDYKTMGMGKGGGGKGGGPRGGANRR